MNLSSSPNQYLLPDINVALFPGSPMHEKGGEPGIIYYVRTSRLIACGQSKPQVLYEYTIILYQSV